MGRELGIYRIDFLKSGTAIIKHSDYNLCGRTEFTRDIANLFSLAEKPVYYLLVARDITTNIPNIVHTVHVRDENEYCSEKEFDIEYAFVDRERIKEICYKNMAKDDIELEREQAMLEDARIARQHSITLNEFEKFSDFIDKLSNYFNNYCEEAKDYWNEFREVENTIQQIEVEGTADNNLEDIDQSLVLLTYSE